MSTREEVARQALALSRDDRASLADLLRHSLTPAEDRIEGAELLAELDRRFAAYLKGKTKAYTLDEAMAELRRRRRADKQT